MQRWRCTPSFYYATVSIKKIAEMCPFWLGKFMGLQTQRSKDPCQECGWMSKKLLDPAPTICKITKTVLLIVTWDTHAIFTGRRLVCPFSVDLYIFCRSFKVQSFTTIKIYIWHNDIFINEAHHVIKSKDLLQIITENW